MSRIPATHHLVLDPDVADVLRPKRGLESVLSQLIVAFPVDGAVFSFTGGGATFFQPTGGAGISQFDRTEQTTVGGLSIELTGQVVVAAVEKIPAHNVVDLTPGGGQGGVGRDGQHPLFRGSAVFPVQKRHDFVGMWGNHDGGARFVATIGGSGTEGITTKATAFYLAVKRIGVDGFVMGGECVGLVQGIIKFGLV
ncbi:MAG: hypothetical protein BWY72_02461 [Bacteroidetes bacterium ADurb.Bin416]|nr:MAG: hypothetical protein BWY72_02461 [Bacteroidetes bacterium ADurb.Bin416]